MSSSIADPSFPFMSPLTDPPIATYCGSNLTGLQITIASGVPFSCNLGEESLKIILSRNEALSRTDCTAYSSRSSEWGGSPNMSLIADPFDTLIASTYYFSRLERIVWSPLLCEFGILTSQVIVADEHSLI